MNIDGACIHFFFTICTKIDYLIEEFAFFPTPSPTSLTLRIISDKQTEKSDLTYPINIIKLTHVSILLLYRVH